MAELTPLVQLGQAFKFSSDDLRANREGKLTFRQRRRIWQRFWQALITALLMLLIPIIVTWFLLFWQTSATLADVLNHPAALIGYSTGAILAAFYIIANAPAFFVVIDVWRGRVQAISGPVERYGQYLVLKKRRFLLESNTLDLIQNGLRYTFYILPGSQHILSVEFAE